MSLNHKFKSAYILPIARHSGEVYVLLGKERDSQDYSGFGGTREKGETPVDTVIREGWEETLGFLPKRFLKSVLPRASVDFVPSCQHYYFTINIDKDSMDPQLYESVYNFMMYCGKDRMAHFCSEKTNIAWVNIKALQSAVKTKNIHLPKDIKLSRHFLQDLSTLHKM